MLDGQVKDIVISFADITKEKHHDKINFYWGPIVSVKKRQMEKYGSTQG
ncbi:hypothetical protein G114_15838 [Aeromonas diversa CDC 2478-85]|uniref:Uncharacterized protein n=2 Tax=Aeromonas diversa TaxID=502790 RepID=N9VGY9_9GAMM|nr:hypothetical protein G114_15838 [Aeromonas diversa CDC 2478-85]